MQRIQHPEILPLEIGELCVGDGVLGAVKRYAEFPGALRQAIEMLRNGQATLRSGDPLPTAVRGFETVFLAGGRAGEPAVRTAMAKLSCPAVFGTDGLFAGAAGGFDWLRTHGLSGWVVDLGQTHLKIVAPKRQWAHPRDRRRLPSEYEVPMPQWSAHRRRLCEFIALKLRLAVAEAGRPPCALVFALPSRLSADGTPLGGGYAGMRDNATLLGDVIELAGLAGRPWFVLNDAELAALSARLDPRLAESGKVLVLTIGFAVGAALMHRAAAGPTPRT